MVEPGSKVWLVELSQTLVAGSSAAAGTAD